GPPGGFIGIVKFGLTQLMPSAYWSVGQQTPRLVSRMGGQHCSGLTVDPGQHMPVLSILQPGAQVMSFDWPDEGGCRTWFRSSSEPHPRLGRQSFGSSLSSGCGRGITGGGSFLG